MVPTHLYYFLPAVEEALNTPFGPEYVAYLATRIRPFVTEKERLLAAAIPAHP